MTALKSVGYQSVRLLDGPFKTQRDKCIEQILLHPSVGEIINGVMARKTKTEKLSCSGKVGAGVFLSAYIRLYLSTEDERLQEKSLALYNAWTACVQDDSDCLDCDVYEYGTLMEGLMDVSEYLGIPDAKTYMRLLTEHAVRNLDPENYRSEKAKAEIVKDYLTGLLKSKPETDFGGGMAVVAPPKKPRTLEEAAILAREYIKIKGET